MQAGNHMGRREPGTRHPEGHASRGDPADPKMPRPTARTKHKGQKKPLRSRGRSLDAPSLHKSNALWAGSGHRADAHMDTDTDTNTDTQVH